jgi:hypothetical protein
MDGTAGQIHQEPHILQNIHHHLLLNIRTPLPWPLHQGLNRMTIMSSIPHNPQLRNGNQYLESTTTHHKPWAASRI